MKNIAVLCLGALLAIVGGCSRPPTEQNPESGYQAWLHAIPSPQDSIIIESKTLTAGMGAPAAVVRVFITNKDTLAAYVLVLEERSLTGGAYMTLSHPRNFNGVVNPLTGSLQVSTPFNGNWYNGTSPDTFLIAGFWHPLDVATTAEPPNLSRKAFLEIKFDTVSVNQAEGTLEFESTFLSFGVSFHVTCFVDQSGNMIKTNFLKGTLNITAPNPSSTFLDKGKKNEPF